MSDTKPVSLIYPMAFFGGTLFLCVCRAVTKPSTGASAQC
jgi:hypothetical protein